MSLVKLFITFILGNLGNRWHMAFINLPLSKLNVSHQVVMQGVVGSGYHGDIAIDDFAINEGLCPNAGKI
jgi:hypothetical protein